MRYLCRLKQRIEGVLNTDRTVRIVVQLEAALHDSRLEVSIRLHTCRMKLSPLLNDECYIVRLIMLKPDKFCLLQEAAQLRDELSNEYDRRAAAEVREKQQLDL